jgi:prepilin peptidase CpaA
MTSLFALLLIACAVAVVTDLNARRIPNWLTVSLAAFALGLQATHGWIAFANAFACGVLVLFVGSFAHRAKILGGGDVKLLAAGACTLGFPAGIIFVLYTFIGGGFLALGFAIAQRRLRSTFANVRDLAVTRTAIPDTASSARMPYAVAIAFGALATVLAETILPAVRIPL